MRQVSSLMASLALAALLGCTTYRTVENGVVPPSATVRADFETPRDIVVHDASGNAVEVVGVTRLEGMLMEQTPDTLTLELSLARVRDGDRTRSVRYSEGAFARIPTQTIEQKRTHVLGTVLMAGAIVLALAIVISAATYEPAPPPPPKDSPKTTA